MVTDQDSMEATLEDPYILRATSSSMRWLQ
jgi:hypothetical protein